MRKRVVFCTLLAAMLLVSSMPAYADDQITGINEDFCDDVVYVNGTESIQYDGIEDLEYLYDVQPGTTFFLPLVGRDFEWDGGRGKEITPELAKRQGISVECDRLNEDAVPIISSISIAQLDGLTGISIRFADTLLSAEAVSFDLQAMLKAQSFSTTSSANFTLKGTLRNRRIIVTKSSEPIKLGAGRMGMAYQNYDALDFALGSGVILHAPARAYDELIGVAVERQVSTDTKSKYPSVEKLYTLDTINLNGTASFDLEGLWYIYSGNMTYLGTTEQPVTQQTRYYLSRVRF